MPAKAVLDLGRRRMGMTKSLWNRLTPTRGMGRTAAELARLAAQEDIRLGVEPKGLLLGQKNIEGSRHCAWLLFRAGIKELVIPQGMSQTKIRELLNSLTDKSVKGMSKALPRLNATLEREGMPFTRRQAYFDLFNHAPALYADTTWYYSISQAARGLLSGLGAIGGGLAGPIIGVELEEMGGVERSGQGILLLVGIPLGAGLGYLLGKLSGALLFETISAPDRLFSGLRHADGYDEIYITLKNFMFIAGNSPERAQEMTPKVKRSLDSLSHSLSSRYIDALPEPVRSSLKKPAPAKAELEKPEEEEIDPEDFRGTGGTPPYMQH